MKNMQIMKGVFHQSCNTLLATKIWQCLPYINDRVSNYYEANANFEILISNLMMTSKTAHRVVRKY